MALSLSLLGCAALVLRVHNRWKSSPAIMSSEVKTEPVWQFPFPAVTVCPEMKSRQRQFNFTGAYHRIHRVRGEDFNDSDIDLDE